jgi:hypothetical protein
MSVPGAVVVPFTVFVAYRERRSATAAVPWSAAQIDLGVTSLSSAKDERRVAPEAAATGLRATAGKEPRS